MLPVHIPGESKGEQNVRLAPVDHALAVVRDPIAVICRYGLHLRNRRIELRTLDLGVIPDRPFGQFVTD